MPYTGANNNFRIRGSDIGAGPYGLIPLEFFIDAYPNIFPNFKKSNLWLMGDNQYGQLGDGTVIHRSSPVQLSTSVANNWNKISAGDNFNVSINSNTETTLFNSQGFSWGNNNYGQLGDNTMVNKSSPVLFQSSTDVSCGWNHISTITNNGDYRYLWTWGRNDYGQLGDGTTIHRSSPVQVAGNFIWSQVSCRAWNTAATKIDGTLWTWGRNDYGQLGDGTTIHKSSPVQTVGAGTTWKIVSCGVNHMAAIKTDGTLWSWGVNDQGQLGDGTRIHRSSPVQVGVDTTWRTLSCGTNYTAAIKTDGTLWSWGYNDLGQLGDETQTHRSSPVQTIAAGTKWKYVSCSNHTAAIKTDGTLWLWGYNNLGQLGTNDIEHRSSPVQTVSPTTNWMRVAAGNTHTIMIRESNFF